MKKLGSFFRLVRWPNLIITALMMFLVYHNLTGMISTVGFTLLVVSMVLIVAGGYVINDIFDMDDIFKADGLDDNEPEKKEQEIPTSEAETKETNEKPEENLEKV